MNNYEEDISVYSGHYEIEILIDRPVAQVWKQYLNIASWVTSHHIEQIRGEPGTVGSITRVSFTKANEMGMTLPHYHYGRLIKVVPERQWLLKAYSEKGGSYGVGMTSFDDGRVFAIDAHRTRVTFNLFAETRGDAVAKNPGGMNYDISRDGMQKNLENLKRIVES